MNKYEAMFVLSPDLSEEEKKTLFVNIGEAVNKHNGKVLSASVWAQRMKLYFPIKKHREAMYYLMQFSAQPLMIKDINHVYKLNEDILRVLITRAE